MRWRAFLQWVSGNPLKKNRDPVRGGAFSGSPHSVDADQIIDDVSARSGIASTSSQLCPARDIDFQGNFQIERGCHDAADQLGQSRYLSRWRLEDQLVVDLEQHAGRETPAPAEL